MQCNNYNIDSKLLSSLVISSFKFIRIESVVYNKLISSLLTNVGNTIYNSCDHA